MTPVGKNISELYAEAEHEKVVLWSDPQSKYRGIIAIHSTKLGPAVGGTRYFNYGCDKVASIDALRLSRAMSFKNALAGLPFGGGKAVIIGDHTSCNREQIFRAHGRFVESLKGEFITGEDVGTRPADMEVVHKETGYVAGLPGRSGDPARMTGLGVFRAMQACAKQRWGSDNLKEKTVAIQGCGATGYYLAEKLHEAGARITVADLDQQRSQKFVREFGASVVEPDDIFQVEADIFAPCALGGVINDHTVPKLKVEIVVGSATNQLLADAHGDALAERNILFAPDYVANAGGIINGCQGLLDWDESTARHKVNETYDRMEAILELAKRQDIPPFRAATHLAQKLLNN